MDSDVKVFIIPDETCRRAGMGVTWSPINQFAAFPTQYVKNMSDTPSAFKSENSVHIFQVQQEVALFHPVLRQLVNEATGTFLELQRAVESGEVSKEQNKELLGFSIQYRSVIRACLENLREEIGRSDGSKQVMLQELVTVFYSIECVWHLCEILFIAHIPGYLIINALLDWVRFHIPKYERNAAHLLSGELVSLEHHPDYWDTVIGSLLQGRTEIVVTLLSLHSKSSSTHFQMARQVLKTMPIYSIQEGVSVTEFNLKWKHWLVDAQTKIDSKQFISEPKLNFIMKLVVGEEAAWADVQNQCEAWYELLAGWLFYTEPTVKTFELGRYARRCLSRMNADVSHLDTILLAAMESNVEMINEIQQLSDNGWFVTHLVDLMFHAGHLEQWQANQSSASKLRESFLIEYGSLLMSHESVWQIGLNYLDHCPNEGISTIELLLPRIRADTEYKAGKIIREAQKRDLLHIVHSVAKIQGMRSLRNGRLGNALIWSLKSQDATFVSYLADCFMREYIKTGELPDCDLLNNLGSSMMACDRLIFLAKYYEFHQLYRNRQFQDSAKCIVSLVSSKFAPKFFWASLLSDATTLLESDVMLLSSNDTYNLMNCLQERVESDQEVKKYETTIRNALARNLARALTFEAEFTQN